MRNSPNNREHYAQFLEDHDVDVFVATWASHDLHRETHEVIPSVEVDVETSLRTRFGSSLKAAWIGDMSQFENNTIEPRRRLWNDFIDPANDPLNRSVKWLQRVMDQWYVVQRAYELCNNYDSYDIAIRIRGDMIFSGKPAIPFTLIEDGIHVNGYSWWTNPDDRENGILADGTNLVPYALSDQLAWGKPHWLKKYFEYYNHFGPLFAGRVNWEGRDGTSYRPGTFLFHSEHMLSYYLMRYTYYKESLKFGETDMLWHRHGRDFTWNYRPEGLYIDCDYYYLYKPKGTY